MFLLVTDFRSFISYVAFISVSATRFYRQRTEVFSFAEDIEIFRFRNAYTTTAPLLSHIVVQNSEY